MGGTAIVTPILWAVRVLYNRVCYYHNLKWWQFWKDRYWEKFGRRRLLGPSSSDVLTNRRRKLTSAERVLGPLFDASSSDVFTNRRRKLMSAERVLGPLFDASSSDVLTNRRRKPTSAERVLGRLHREI